jgi:hypothetical protein
MASCTESGGGSPRRPRAGVPARHAGQNRLPRLASSTAHPTRIAHRSRTHRSISTSTRPRARTGMPVCSQKARRSLDRCHAPVVLAKSCGAAQAAWQAPFQARALRASMRALATRARAWWSFRLRSALDHFSEVTSGITTSLLHCTARASLLIVDLPAPDESGRARVVDVLFASGTARFDEFLLDTSRGAP